MVTTVADSARSDPIADADLMSEVVLTPVVWTGSDPASVLIVLPTVANSKKRDPLSHVGFVLVVLSTVSDSDSDSDSGFQKLDLVTDFGSVSVLLLTADSKKFDPVPNFGLVSVALLTVVDPQKLDPVTDLGSDRKAGGVLLAVEGETDNLLPREMGFNSFLAEQKAGEN